MALLEDVGRSGLGVEAERLHRMIMDKRRFGLEEQQVAQKLELGELQGQLSGLQIRQARNRLQLQEKERKRNETAVNLRLTPIYQALTPEGKKDAENLFKSVGLIDDEGVTTVGDLKVVGEAVESIPEFFRGVMGNEVKRKEDAYFQTKATLDKMIVEARAAGKNPDEDKKIAALKAEAERLSQEANRSRSVYEGHAEKIAGNSIGEGKVPKQLEKYIFYRNVLGMSNEEAISAMTQRKPANTVEAAGDYYEQRVEAMEEGLGMTEEDHKEIVTDVRDRFGDRIAKKALGKIYDRYFESKPDFSEADYPLSEEYTSEKDNPLGLSPEQIKELQGAVSKGTEKVISKAKEAAHSEKMKLIVANNNLIDKSKQLDGLAALTSQAGDKPLAAKIARLSSKLRLQARKLREKAASLPEVMANVDAILAQVEELTGESLK